jgi:hypothetical protein
MLACRLCLFHIKRYFAVYDGYVLTKKRENKRWRKPNGQSGMDNPETLATLGTIHMTKTNNSKT